MPEPTSSTTDAPMDLGALLDETDTTSASAPTPAVTAPSAPSTGTAPAPTVTATSLAPIEPAKRLVDTRTLSADLLSKAEQSAAKINFRDPDTLLAHGTEALAPIGAIAERITAGRTIKSTDEVGAIAAAIFDGIKILRIDELQSGTTKSRGIMRSLINRAKSPLQQFAENRKQFNAVMDQQEAKARRLIGDFGLTIQNLTKMSAETRAGLTNLTVEVAAGQIALDRGYEELAALREKAIATDDQGLAAEVMVLRGRLADFEGKISELRFAIARFAGMIPIIAATSRVMESRIGKIQTGLLVTLPGLKAAAALAVAQADERAGADANRKMDEADAAVLRLTAEGTAQGLQRMNDDRGVSANRMTALKEAIETTTAAIKQSIADDSAAQNKALEQEAEIIKIGQQLRTGMIQIAEANLGR